MRYNLTETQTCLMGGQLLPESTGAKTTDPKRF